MSNIEITLTGPDGSSEVFHNDWDICEARGLLHVEDLAGWYGGVGADVVPDIKRFRRHGKFPGRAYRTHRNIDLTLTWHQSIMPGEDGFTAYARWASSLAWGHGPYQLRVVEDGFALNCEVVLDGDPQWQNVLAGSEQAFRMKLNLRANDPFLYGDAQVTSIQGYQRTPALLTDFFQQGYKNAAGEQVLGWSEPYVNPNVIGNSGTVDAYPVFTVTADSYSGVRIRLGGQVVEYGGALTQRSPLVLDYAKGSATINGRDYSSQLVRRNWAALGPGDQDIPQVDFLQDTGIGFATATVRPTFI